MTLFFSIFILMTTVQNGEGWNHIGPVFSINKETALNDLTSKPENFYNRVVKIRGVIASVCNEEGCWIDLVDPVAKTQGILVNFRGLKHYFPLDCVGREAVVEGLFYRKIYGKERVSHWHHHGFRPGEKIPEFSLILRVEASAAEIGGKSVKPPKGGVIRRAQTDKIDLKIVEFESNKFGTGKKCLDEGEEEPSHTTGKYREMIFCLQGRINVEREGEKTVTLVPGEMSYVRPATVHSIKSAGSKKSCYIFVYAPLSTP